MKGVVFDFKPGDPVPSWLLDIEPRQDVPGGLSRVVARPLFNVAGQVIDEGPCYAIQCEFKPGDRRVIVGDLYYCHIVVEKPLRWPNGDVWHGMGGPCPEAVWSPDPERVRQAGRNTDALRDLGRTVRPPVHLSDVKCKHCGVAFGMHLRDCGSVSNERIVKEAYDRLELVPDADGLDAPVAARTFWKAGFLTLAGAVIGAVAALTLYAVLT